MTRFSAQESGNKQKMEQGSATSESNHAFNTRENKKFKGQCHKCQKTGHKSSECWRDHICSKCGDKGHIEKFCRKPSSSNNPRFRSNLVGESDEMQIFTVMENKSTDKREPHLWVIDSGSPRHLCVDKTQFKSMTEYNGSMKTANKQHMKILGVGQVLLELETHFGSCTIELNGCYYVPSVACNLLSVRKLNMEGYTMTFDKDKAWISNQ